MKTLPDSPDMGHLRDQAKDLLAQMRTTRTDASLSEAQAALARRYGFHRWTDLKAEVDRRNASPVRAPSGVAEALAHAFDLGSPTGRLVAVERQWAGHAWSLTTDRGRWLCRELFDWFGAGNVDVEATLAHAAAGAGIETPEPMRSKAGSFIETLDAPDGAKRWRVFRWSPMGPAPTTPADPKLAAAAGRILGRVHALRLSPPAPVHAWLTRRRSEAEWWQLHEAAERAEVSWADALAAAIPTFLEVSTITDHGDPDDAALLSACDYQPGAFQTAGDDLVVVTWEHAGAMPPRWDLGSALARWSGGVHPDEVHAPAAAALLEAYRAASDGLTVEPLDLGIFSADISAHLNWTATRISLALHADDEARRDVAALEVPELLAAPPTRRRYERVLEAVGT